MRVRGTTSSQIISFILMSLLATSVLGQDDGQVTISAELTIATEFIDKVAVRFLCSSGELKISEFEMISGELLELPLELNEGLRTGCQLLASPPDGYSARYQVEGKGAYAADKNGCQFSRIQIGQGNRCKIEISQDPVTIMVYKVWIGASGEENDVKVTLSCESGDYEGERYVSEKVPNGWEIRNVDPEGILCNVNEEVRDTFSPDIIDCQGLLIRPGKGEECTLVNTKIVKRIEMLNRYGKIVMVLLVLAIGLVAVKRIT